MPHLLEILERLPPEEAAVIEAALADAANARNELRLARRDVLIRGARSLHWPGEEFVAPVARQLSAALHDPPGNNSELGRTVTAILDLNNGRPIGERQLSGILRGRRDY